MPRPQLQFSSLVSFSSQALLQALDPVPAADYTVVSLATDSPAAVPPPHTVPQAARQSALAKETANGSSKTDDAGGGGEKKGGHNKRRGRAAAAPPVDPDPLGLTLLEKDPLPEAARLVALLSAHAGAYVETHLLAFDVAMKRGKYLLAARAVIRCVLCVLCVCVFFQRPS